jgi:hypothetical protein
MHSLERSYSAFMQRFGKQLDDAGASYRAEASAYGEDVSAVCLSQRGALHFLGVGVHEPHFFAAARFAEQLQAWAAYRRHRHLYVLNDQLAKLLCEASWPEELDVSSLFLPVRVSFADSKTTELIAVQVLGTMSFPGFPGHPARRHSAAGNQSPINFELAHSAQLAA